MIDWFLPYFRTALLLLSFVFLSWFVLRPKQNAKTNWGVFYTFLYVLFMLPIVNWLCVKFGFWTFTEKSVISIPKDLFFIWLVVWSVLFPFLFKGKRILLSTLIVFWIDFVFMPLLEKTGVMSLNSNWMYGEIAMVLVVYLPAHIWAYFSIYNKKVGLRACFQILIMSSFIFVLVPFTIHQFFPLNESVFVFKPILFQVLLIVSLPGLLAVKELVIKGKGTPFPYDKTQFLVTTGVYAYIRNPIQWSFTFLFVPLSLYYESPWILIGSVISLIYSLSIANQQEFDDMETRFGEAWVSYKKNVPSWFFIWQPKAIAPAQIYFKKDCSYCQELREWLEKKQTYNLEFIDAHEYKKQLTQVTYVDKEAREYSSLNALLNAVQHVNLFWASLAWVLMLPGINHLIQAIIDGLGLFDEVESCSIKQP